MSADDTHPDARAARIRWLRGRSEEERLRMAIQLSEEVRELSRCGIRSRHGNYSPEQVEWALRRLVLGDELFRAAWPHAPLLAS